MNESEYSSYPGDHEFDDFDRRAEVREQTSDEELVDKLVKIADIGDTCDILITKLKSDRRPDKATFQFHFSKDNLNVTTLQIPRRLDVLLDTQFDLEGLSIDFHHSVGTELQGTGLTTTFLLKEKRNPDAAIHTLIANRDGLHAPIAPLADEFTYPPDDNHAEEESIKFPSLSSTDLRRLIISLMPTLESEQYDFQNEYIQQPEHLEALVDIIAKQSSDHTHTISYGLYSPVGDVVGMFTYEQCNDTVTTATLEVPFAQKTVIYEIDLAYTNKLPARYNEEIIDENFGTATPLPQDTPSNTWAVRVKEYYPDQQRTTTPVDASLDELIKLSELLDNVPGIYTEQQIVLQGSGDEIIDPQSARRDD